MAADRDAASLESLAAGEPDRVDAVTIDVTDPATAPTPRATKHCVRSPARQPESGARTASPPTMCSPPRSPIEPLPTGSDPAREAAFAAMYDDHPLGRDGEHDIGAVVTFLLSDASQYVTGQTIGADGGGVLRA